jgi:hypothetical protein
LHDLYSGANTLHLDDACFARMRQASVPAGQIDAGFMQRLLQQSKAQGVWNDHCTSGVFAPDTPTCLMPWEFRPGYWHWLQAGWVA